MQDKEYKSILLMKQSLFVNFTITMILLTVFSCRPVYKDARLYGFLNLVPDSFYMERSKEYKFSSLNFNFADLGVELPIVESSIKVDLHGKTLLDEDINQDSLKKDWDLWGKAQKEASGTYMLPAKDSLRIIAPSHPFHGQYKITFFKTKLYGREHYFMRMTNDSTYIVCEKFFSGFVNAEMLKNWERFGE